MLELTAAAEASLNRSHGIDSRVLAITQTQGRLVLPVDSYEVRSDAKSQVRRTATVRVTDDSYWPILPEDPLSPLSSLLSIEYGILLPGGDVEYVPVFYGIVTDAEISRPDGVISIKAADLSLRVAENRLDGPMTMNTSATIVAEITRLIQETIPGVTVTDLTGSTRACPALVVERERWKDGVEKLADALGAEVFADTVGGFAIRPQPTLADAPVWTVTGGDEGVLIEAVERSNRELVHNRVIADGTPVSADPVRGIVTDTDTNSPTYWGGPFGKRPRFYSSPLLTTVAQCESTAAAFLARSKGAQASITLSTLVHPGLEAGDVLAVELPDGRQQRHIIDSVTIPGSASAAQPITSRATDIEEG
jgi:hypothetical protein